MNLLRALTGTRSRVRCLVHDPAQAPQLALIDDVFDVVVGDVRDPTALATLFEGVSAATVFHAAAVIHPAGRTREFFDVNVGGTELVLDAAVRSGSARFVHVSSNSVCGANPGPDDRFTEESPYAPYMGYGQSKEEAERLVARASDRGDLETVVVRAPWFYGPFQPDRQTRFLATARRGRFPLVGDGSNRRSMVYTQNLVDGLLLAASVPAAAGRTYWIADGEPVAMRDVIATVRAAFVAEGMEVSGGSPRMPRLVGVVAEHVDALLQRGGRYSQTIHVLGELKDTIACDISRARRELGYEPQVDLLEGMRRSIRWCLDHGHAL